MKKIITLAMATALAASFGAPTVAQNAPGAGYERFGPASAAEGWSGSLGFGPSATFGNTEAGDLSLDGRLRHGDGSAIYGFSFSGQYSEENGSTTKEDLVVTHDVTAYVSDRAYLFGLGRVRYDGIGRNEWDTFVGAGPGYLVSNQPRSSWRLQAGPGVRYLQDQAGRDTSEVAAIMSSRAYRQLLDRVYFTGDTDILVSEDSALFTSELALTYTVSDNVALRTSFRNKWNSDPAPGRDEFDRSLNLSLVAGF